MGNKKWIEDARQRLDESLVPVPHELKDSPGSDVPFLRLRGRWLQDAGFAIGRNVRVEVSEGRLMIEPVD